MKNFRKVACAVLSLAVVAGTVSTAISLLTRNESDSISLNAAADSLSEIQTNWQSMLAAEQGKLPESIDGNQCYWNGHNPDCCTLTPCQHDTDGIDYCTYVLPQCNYYNTAYELVNDMQDESRTTYGQCIGFAYQLASDMFRTDVFIRYALEEGSYTLSDGRCLPYEPKAGDVVRLFGGLHSIFITDVIGDDIIFAQCNADGFCGVDWDAVSYCGNVVTTEYLQHNADYFDRPALVGDLDLDGVITESDVVIFEETMRQEGTAIGDIGNTPYDVDGSGFVDMDDYNAIRFLAKTKTDDMPIVTSSEDLPCRWHTMPEDCFVDENGAYYLCVDGKTAAFIGMADSEVTEYEIPSVVYSEERNCEYLVTAIGAPDGDGWFTRGLEVLTIPDTVQTINSNAFLHGSLTSLKISGKDPLLRTIGDYAFFGCSVDCFDFSSCKVLEQIGVSAFAYNAVVDDIVLPYSIISIGEYAFEGCSAMKYMEVKSRQSGNCSLNTIGDGAFYGCTSLIHIDIPTSYSALMLGTDEGVFDTDAEHKVKLFLDNNTARNRSVFLCDSDIEAFRAGTLVIFAGNYSVHDAELDTVAKNGTSKTQLLQPDKK